MIEKVRQNIAQKEKSAFHQKILTSAMSLIKTSRSDMSEYYGKWDLHDQVFRGERPMDKDDLKQAVQDKPIKMIVPNTYTQVMTFASFLFLLYNQNRRFFELTPTGPEDRSTKREDQELVLENNWKYNKGNMLLFQHLLDIPRYGLGVIECGWTRKVSRIHAPLTPVEFSLNGRIETMSAGSEWQEIVRYEGNLVRAVSPYHFFPDTRKPLTSLDDGEFCAVEEEYTMAQLKELELAGEVYGVEHIEPLSDNVKGLRGAITRLKVVSKEEFRKGFDPSKPNSLVCVTKLRQWIIPSQYELDPQTKLGPEEFPILYHVWYANDNRIIRLEPVGWWHGGFGITAAQFTPDMQHTINFGMAELVYRLQDVISWFINSHITSVRRVMRNRLIVDPELVDTKSLDGEKDIYLRRGSAVALDRAVGQLKVQDVTASHMGDTQVLEQIMRAVTGISENAAGQYHGGRRSASEARAVASGTTSRMKLHGHLIWDQSFGPLGQIMLSNCRQALPEEMFNLLIGQMEDPQGRFAQFQGTPQEVAAASDYFMFDATVESEKIFVAQSLQELLVSVIGNPAAAQMLDIDPRTLLEEIQLLRGAGTPKRFSLAANVAAGAPPLMPPQIDAGQNQTA